MTQGDVVYLSVLEHKLQEIERNAYEFRRILRHYISQVQTGRVDGEGEGTIRENEEEPGGLSDSGDGYANPEEEGCSS